MKFTSNGDIAVHVTDINRAKKFYQEILGFDLKTDSQDKLVFDTGKFTLYINKDEKNIPFIPALNVDNFQKAKVYLKNNGCKIIREWPEYNALYFEDPFGIIIDVIQKHN
jgi:catechol-2,3-dioxygenase